MDGKKKARINRCTKCEHCVMRSSRFAGPHGFAKFCTAEAGKGSPNRWQELHDDFMEGPDDNCPMGYWTGLAPKGPVDPAKYQQSLEEKRKERIREQSVPQVQRIMESELSDTDLTPDAVLQAAVALNVIPAWAAQEIRDKRTRHGR